MLSTKSARELTANLASKRSLTLTRLGLVFLDCVTSVQFASVGGHVCTLVPPFSTNIPNIVFIFYDVWEGIFTLLAVAALTEIQRHDRSDVQSCKIGARSL